jgi:hypothetical protein
LQARWNPLTSSLVLGVVWGLYHLPAWFVSGTPQEGVSLVVFMVSVIPFNVFLCWVFNRANGSLIMAFLCHFAFNFIGNATGIFRVAALQWLVAGIWWLIALAIVALDWGRFIQPAALPTAARRREA